MSTDQTTPPKKQHKVLTVEFTDEAAFAAAYPGFMETITITRPNRKLAYPMIKAMHTAKVAVPGVNAYYASEEPPVVVPESLPTVTHVSLQEQGDPGAGIITRSPNAEAMLSDMPDSLRQDAGA